MNLYEKFTSKPYSFFVIDATPGSDNLSSFRKNLLERIQKLIMTIDDKIKDEKLQYDTNRWAAKVSALSLGNIDKYEYPIGEEILPSDQKKTIEQTQFTYFPLGKVLEKPQKKKRFKGQVKKNK